MKNKFLLIATAFCGLNVTVFAGNNDDLTKACMKGDLAGAEKAIAAGADVNGKDAVGWLPLQTAIFYPEITKLLLDKKANPNLGDNPALFMASGVGSYEVMKHLLNAGADPNKGYGSDPSVSIRRLLDEEKAKGKKANKQMVKAYEDMLATAAPATMLYPIQVVVSKTLCKECLDILIEKGAKTNVLNANNGTLLDELALSYLTPVYWIENNKAQVGGWEKLGFAMPDWYKSPAVSALGTADAMVAVLVKAGVDINAINKTKDTPLLTALLMAGLLNDKSYTKREIIIAIVNNGANVNVEGHGYKGHALLQVAGLGFVDVLEAMFAKGADMNMEFKVNDLEVGQTLKGITPLMWSARNGQLDAVKYLVGKGAKLGEMAEGTSYNTRTQCLTKVSNKSTIFYAVEGENLEVVKYLVENTSGDWKEAMKISELKHTSNHGDKIIITCFSGGNYSASKYAKECGFSAIVDYLKSKKL